MTMIQFLSTLCLSFLLLASTISAQQDDAVLDSQGNKLQEASKYYILPSIFGPTGGGLSLSNYHNEECATTVTQEPYEVERGIPITFHPADSTPDGGAILLSKSLNIKFDPDSDAIPSCVNSTVWTVGGLDAYTRSLLITVEGEQGNPGCSTKRNWFKIEKGSRSYSYKLVTNAHDVCSDEENENYGLRVTSAFHLLPLIRSRSGNAFDVVFLKYEDANVNNGNKAAYAAV